MSAKLYGHDYPAKGYRSPKSRKARKAGLRRARMARKGSRAVRGQMSPKQMRKAAIAAKKAARLSGR